MTRRIRPLLMMFVMQDSIPESHTHASEQSESVFG